MKLEEFERHVSTEMECLYGLSWADASGDDELLQQALADGETPLEFVERFGQKYDLIPRSKFLVW